MRTRTLVSATVVAAAVVAALPGTAQAARTGVDLTSREGSWTMTDSDTITFTATTTGKPISGTTVGVIDYAIGVPPVGSTSWATGEVTTTASNGSTIVVTIQGYAFHNWSGSIYMTGSYTVTSYDAGKKVVSGGTGGQWLHLFDQPQASGTSVWWDASGPLR